MVFPQGAPMLGWEKLLEEELRTMKQDPEGKQSSMSSSKGSSRSSSEASTSPKVTHAAKSTPRPSKMASIKSYLRGDIQRHHGMYILEEAVTGQSSAARASHDSSARSASVQSASSKSSSLRKLFGSASHDDKPKPKSKPQYQSRAQMRHFGAVPNF